MDTVPLQRLTGPEDDDSSTHVVEPYCGATSALTNTGPAAERPGLRAQLSDYDASRLRFMADTWASRDLPVLDAIVKALEDQPDVSAAQVARMTQIPGEEVVKAFYALEATYTGHVEAVLGGDAGSVFVSRVTAAGRRTVGQWPTAESLVDRLAAGIAMAAEREPDPQKKSRLVAIADFLAGYGREVAVGVAAQIVGQQVPH